VIFIALPSRPARPEKAGGANFGIYKAAARPAVDRGAAKKIAA